MADSPSKLVGWTMSIVVEALLFGGSRNTVDTPSTAPSRAARTHHRRSQRSALRR